MSSVQVFVRALTCSNNCCKTVLGRPQQFVFLTRNTLQVLKWMPHGRLVRMEPEDLSSGVEAAAAGARPRRRPPSHALGPFFVLGVKESQQKETKSAIVASAAVTAFSGASTSKGAPTARNNDTDAEGAAVGGGESGGGAQVSRTR